MPIVYFFAALASGIVGVLMVASVLVDFEWKNLCIGFVLIVLTLFIIFTPQADSTQLIYDHKVLLTDTYREIKYDKVIRVEYDTRKGPWWSWQALGSDVNFKIVTEGVCK